MSSFLRGISFDHIGLGDASKHCLALAAGYVAVLYVVTPENRSRNDPEIIRRRSIAVMAATLLSPLFVYSVGRFDDSAPNMLQHLGLHFGTETLFAVCLPLTVNACLFAGPLLQLYFDDELSDTFQFRAMFTDWVSFRAAVVAPITEEIVFRGCMVPLLLPSLGHSASLHWITPTFFGVAHLHHLIAGTRPAVVLLQFGYTTVFGALATFFFDRTSNILGPIVCHTFCNLMGFPNFGGVDESEKHSTTLKVAYVAGVVSFFSLMRPLTEPSLFLPSSN